MIQVKRVPLSLQNLLQGFSLLTLVWNSSSLASTPDCGLLFSQESSLPVATHEILSAEDLDEFLSPVIDNDLIFSVIEVALRAEDRSPLIREHAENWRDFSERWEESSHFRKFSKSVYLTLLSTISRALHESDRARKRLLAGDLSDQRLQDLESFLRGSTYAKAASLTIGFEVWLRDSEEFVLDKLSRMKAWWRPTINYYLPLAFVVVPDANLISADFLRELSESEQETVISLIAATRQRQQIITLANVLTQDSKFFAHPDLGVILLAAQKDAHLELLEQESLVSAAATLDFLSRQRDAVSTEAEEIKRQLEVLRSRLQELVRRDKAFDQQILSYQRDNDRMVGLSSKMSGGKYLVGTNLALLKLAHEMVERERKILFAQVLNEDPAQNSVFLEDLVRQNHLDERLQGIYAEIKTYDFGSFSENEILNILREAVAYQEELEFELSMIGVLNLGSYSSLVPRLTRMVTRLGSDLFEIILGEVLGKLFFSDDIDFVIDEVNVKNLSKSLRHFALRSIITVKIVTTLVKKYRTTGAHGALSLGERSNFAFFIKDLILSRPLGLSFEGQYRHLIDTFNENLDTLTRSSVMGDIRWNGVYDRARTLDGKKESIQSEIAKVEEEIRKLEQK